MAQALSQHHPTIQSNFWALISVQVNKCQGPGQLIRPIRKNYTGDVIRVKTNQ